MGDRLTKEQIEALILAHEDEPAHERPLVTNGDFIQICRRALSLESVRSEALEALRELVACKDLKDALDDGREMMPHVTAEQIEQMREDYIRRKPLAWNAARVALQSSEDVHSTELRK